MATWKLGPYNTDNQYIKYHINVTETAQSVANNTTTLSVTVNFYRTNSGYESYGSGTLYCKIYDTWYEQAITSSQVIKYAADTTLFSKTVTVPHNADGVRDCWVGAYIQHDVVTSEHQGRYVTLTTIPRMSSFSAPNGTLGSALKISITRKSDAFTHTLTYKCGSASGTIATKTASTSVNWTPPISLAAQNTTGVNVPITLTMTAYSGSTSLGSASVNISCAIPASVAPSCSFTLTDVENIDDIYGSPVQNLSRIKVDVTATTAQGSPIKSYTIEINGERYSSQSAVSGYLEKYGDSVVKATVTDARGRSGSTSYTMRVQQYNHPKVSNLTVHRVNADGSENAQGEYIKATFSAAVYNIGSKNTAAYKLQYKRSGDTVYTDVTLSALAGSFTVTNYAYIFAADSGSSYDVTVSATDKHRTATTSTSASTAFTIMNLHRNGTGVAFGKVAETDNTMEVALDAQFRGSTIIQGNRYSLSTPGESGSEGYILMARIVIKAANADTPITFVLSSRQREATMTVYVSLRNSGTDSSTLGSIRYEGTNYGAFLVQVSGNTWDLYVQKGTGYDTITLQDWYTSRTMEDRVQVTLPGTLVATLPGEYYRATPAMLDSLRDYIYPVGSVYISYSHVDPAQLFGGTWARIENAFLWAVDANGAIGLTGGEKTHTLTEAELPAHDHGSVYSQHAAGDKKYAWYTTSGSAVAYGAVSAGGGQAHNNMPPYIQVSVWRRTA